MVILKLLLSIQSLHIYASGVLHYDFFLTTKDKVSVKPFGRQIKKELNRDNSF